MVVVLIALVGGLAVGLLRGGTLGALARVRVLRPALIVLGVAALVAGDFVGGRAYAVVSVVAVVAVAAFLVYNRRLPGLVLVALGLAVNALVIGVNVAMPVSLYAAGRAGVSVHGLADDPRHTPADHTTKLNPLGDAIPVALPGIPAVVSVGDVLAAAGVGLFAAVAPVRARRTLEARRAGTQAAAGPPRPPAPAADEQPAKEDGPVAVVGSFESGPVDRRPAPAPAADENDRTPPYGQPVPLS